eukprot:TRINITY_DN5390_c2_g1_i2.p1 TRINITY_DN5390_c2_g1~~TRINITY_DN5390_c2_g1_i2.p1  ORF type:complete len:982 (+),score=221.62 TRINITY_DN5390_c2_g1_i2:75-2948(+)
MNPETSQGYGIGTATPPTFDLVGGRLPEESEEERQARMEQSRQENRIREQLKLEEEEKKITRRLLEEAEFRKNAEGERADLLKHREGVLVDTAKLEQAEIDRQYKQAQERTQDTWIKEFKERQAVEVRLDLMKKDRELHDLESDAREALERESRADRKRVRDLEQKEWYEATRASAYHELHRELDEEDRTRKLQVDQLQMLDHDQQIEYSLEWARHRKLWADNDAKEQQASDAVSKDLLMQRETERVMAEARLKKLEQQCSSIQTGINKETAVISQYDSVPFEASVPSVVQSFPSASFPAPAVFEEPSVARLPHPLIDNESESESPLRQFATPDQSYITGVAKASTVEVAVRDPRYELDVQEVLTNKAHMESLMLNRELERQRAVVDYLSAVSEGKRSSSPARISTSQATMQQRVGFVPPAITKVNESASIKASVSPRKELPSFSPTQSPPPVVTHVPAAATQVVPISTKHQTAVIQSAPHSPPSVMSIASGNHTTVPPVAAPVAPASPVHAPSLFSTSDVASYVQQLLQPCFNKIPNHASTPAPQQHSAPVADPPMAHQMNPPASPRAHISSPSPVPLGPQVPSIPAATAPPQLIQEVVGEIRRLAEERDGEKVKVEQLHGKLIESQTQMEHLLSTIRDEHQRQADMQGAELQKKLDDMNNLKADRDRALQETNYLKEQLEKVVVESNHLRDELVSKSSVATGYSMPLSSPIRSTASLMRSTGPISHSPALEALLKPSVSMASKASLLSGARQPLAFSGVECTPTPPLKGTIEMDQVHMLMQELRQTKAELEETKTANTVLSVGSPAPRQGFDNKGFYDHPSASTIETDIPVPVPIMKRDREVDICAGVTSSEELDGTKPVRVSKSFAFGSSTPRFGSASSSRRDHNLMYTTVRDVPAVEAFKRKTLRKRTGSIGARSTTPRNLSPLRATGLSEELAVARRRTDEVLRLTDPSRKL